MKYITNFKARINKTPSITLTWTIDDITATTVSIYRKKEDGSYIKLADIKSSISSFIDYTVNIIEENTYKIYSNKSTHELEVTLTTLYCWVKSDEGIVSKKRPVLVSRGNLMPVQQINLLSFTLPEYVGGYIIEPTEFKTDIQYTHWLINTTGDTPSVNNAGWKNTTPISYTVNL